MAKFDNAGRSNVSRLQEFRGDCLIRPKATSSDIKNATENVHGTSQEKAIEEGSSAAKYLLFPPPKGHKAEAPVCVVRGRIRELISQLFPPLCLLDPHTRLLSQAGACQTKLQVLLPSELLSAELFCLRLLRKAAYDRLSVTTCSRHRF